MIGYFIPDDNAFGNIPKAYCPRCEKVGIRKRMEKMPDNEDRLQCKRCGYNKPIGIFDKDEDEKENTDEKLR